MASLLLSLVVVAACVDGAALRPEHQQVRDKVKCMCVSVMVVFIIMTKVCLWLLPGSYFKLIL